MNKFISISFEFCRHAFPPCGLGRQPESGAKTTAYRRYKILFWAILLLGGIVFCSNAASSVKTPQSSADFLRTDESGETTALVCPILTFERNSLRVDLITTVHFADAAYYENLNRLFTDYDVVLVEMVAPRGVTLSQIAASPRKPSGEMTKLGLLERFQKGFGKALGLVNQQDVIDYGAPNLVRADMDAETLFQRMTENGDFRDFFLEETDEKEGETTNDEIAHGEDISVISFLFARNRRLLLRRFFAVELANGLFLEPLFEKSLIWERDQIVLDELKIQIEGKKRKIAIFYGAAHMTDLTERLETDLGLTLTRVRELIAWDLSDR